MPKLPLIEIGYPVFLADGASAFGAVREVVPDGEAVLLVNIEGTGDVRVPLAAIAKVVSNRVVVSWERLDQTIRDAIHHAHDREDYPPSEVEIELALAAPGSAGEHARAPGSRPRLEGPPGEVAGHEEGARWLPRRRGPHPERHEP